MDILIYIHTKYPLLSEVQGEKKKKKIFFEDQKSDPR